MSPRMKPAAASEALDQTLDDLDAATAHALTALGPAMEWDLAQDVASAVGTVARVQDLVRRLRDIESLAARAVGQAVGRVEGELPDGRTFTVRRTADRKAWDHERWQYDARSKVADQVLDDVPDTVVDPESGEAVSVGAIVMMAMASIEHVHGSTAPRVTSLKALGLDPGDYCETVRGNWTVDTLAPSPTTPATTTDSGEQNHG